MRSILRYYDLKKRRQKTMAYNVYSMDLSANKSTLALYTSEGLRVVESSSGMLDEDEDGYSRQTGWINLHRVQIEVDRRAEWGQMLREIWRLMREHFWREDMSGINWDAILTRYEPLLDRIATRGEFSDLFGRCKASWAPVTHMNLVGTTIIHRNTGRAFWARTSSGMATWTLKAAPKRAATALNASSKVMPGTPSIARH